MSDEMSAYLHIFLLKGKFLGYAQPHLQPQSFQYENVDDTPLRKYLSWLLSWRDGYVGMTLKKNGGHIK